MRKIWMRLGVSLEITGDEERDIFYGCGVDAEKALKRAVKDGRFVLDGNSYIPGACIEQFNKKYDTNHGEEDIDIEIRRENTWNRRKSFRYYLPTAIKMLRNIFSHSKRG